MAIAMLCVYAACTSSDPPEVPATTEHLACLVTAMEAVPQPLVCHVTATGAIPESLACPVLATEAIPKPSACHVVTTEVIPELSACPVTAIEAIPLLCAKVPLNMLVYVVVMTFCVFFLYFKVRSSASTSLLVMGPPVAAVCLLQIESG